MNIAFKKHMVSHTFINAKKEYDEASKLLQEATQRHAKAVTFLEEAEKKLLAVLTEDQSK